MTDHDAFCNCNCESDELARVNKNLSASIKNEQRIQTAYEAYYEKATAEINQLVKQNLTLEAALTVERAAVAEMTALAAHFGAAFEWVADHYPYVLRAMPRDLLTAIIPPLAAHLVAVVDIPDDPN